MGPIAVITLLLLVSSLLAKENDDEVLRNEAPTIVHVNKKITTFYGQFGRPHGMIKLQNVNGEHQEVSKKVKEELSDNKVNQLFEKECKSKEVEKSGSLLNHSIGGMIPNSKPAELPCNKTHGTSPIFLNSGHAKEHGNAQIKRPDLNDVNGSLKGLKTPATNGNEDTEKKLKTQVVIPDTVVTSLDNQNSSNFVFLKPKKSSKLVGKETVVPHANGTLHRRVKKSAGFARILFPGSRWNKTRRLVGGRQVSISEYPYTVAIERNGAHICTGSIVTNYHIISSASCFWRSSRGRTLMAIRAGSTDSSSGGVLIRIREVMKHPKYDVTKDPDFDVAVLKLERPLKFTYDAAPLELPKLESEPAFKDAWVTGWGSKRKDGVVEGDSLMGVFHAKYIDSVNCARAYGDLVYVTPNFICFTTFDEDEKSPCISDSGAPAVSDHYLWGVASFGLRGACGDKKYPGAFTSIAAPDILNFIKKMIAKHEKQQDDQEISLERHVRRGFE